MASEESNKDLLIATVDGDLTRVIALLDWGGDPDSMNDHGTTVLMLASTHGHKKIVKVLLDKGANPSRRNKSGYTAAEYAKQKGHDDLVQLIRDASKNDTEIVGTEIPKNGPIASRDEAVDNLGEFLITAGVVTLVCGGLLFFYLLNEFTSRSIFGSSDLSGGEVVALLAVVFYHAILATPYFILSKSRGGNTNTGQSNTPGNRL